MIFRPVTPVSPLGPPISKGPAGLTQRRKSAVRSLAGTSGSMISRVTSCVTHAGSRPRSICVEITTSAMPATLWPS